MSNSLKIATVLLAAGQSSRMEGIKQLLPWKKTFLLQHCLNTLLEIDSEKIILVLGANFNKIKPQLLLDKKKVEVIENQNWQKGLGDSIAKGTQWLLKNNESKPDGILFCLADQPLITSDYLNTLIARFKMKSHPIIASGYIDKVGVPAIFSPEHFDDLLNLDSDYGAKNVIKKYQSNIETIRAEHLLADIDTPEEYEELYQLHHEQ